MPLTLKEIAKLAGVHPSTVSRVASNDPDYRIADVTRAKIQQLILESEYRPHAAARGLRLNRTMLVSMVVPDIGNPAFAAMLRGAEEVATEAGYDVMLCNTDSRKERELSHIRALENGRADGVLLASAVLHDPSVSWLRGHGVAHVLISRFSDERGPFVGVDDEAGTRLAMTHLLELGHRRIGHLAGSLDTSTGAARRRAFRAALRAAGIAPVPELEHDAEFVASGGARGMSRMLDLPHPPTAVFAANDRAAVGAYEAVEARGLRIPDDVSVVGFNDIDAATHVRPQLTSVRVPFDEMGRLACRLLLDQLADPRRRGTQRIALEPELIVRRSTCPARTT